ncbi:MAG: mechanosensitive ion channel family protein [Oscillospiraceae bacterium]|jgi:small-conductance mechanosensitive channel|nr:mechanosensitive ion channel family protein [Oscillospiraceae bacterium]
MNFINKIIDALRRGEGTMAVALIRFAVAVLITAALLKIISVVLRRAEKSRRERGMRFGYIRVLRYALVALVLIGCAAAVFSGSAQQAFGAVLASSGVAAIVLSIACQEPIGNLCSGLIIILTSPFKIGDVIRHVGLDATGTVEEVTLRHTVIRTFENKRLIIPNSDMNKAAIENANYGESRVCFPMEFSITYESDAETAMQVIRNAIQRHPGYDDAKAEEARAAGREPVEVLVNRLEPLGIVLKVWVWSATLSASYKMKSDIYIEVRKRFRFAHVDFAYPRILAAGGTSLPAAADIGDGDGGAGADIKSTAGNAARNTAGNAAANGGASK